MPATEKVTVAGKEFTMPCPFEEGHVLTVGEAAQLNQVYHENLRNNIAKKVKEAVEKGAFDQAEWQEKINSLAESYEFGKRRSGGPRAPADPVKREALRLAQEAIEDKLRASGRKPKDFSNLKDLAAQLVEQNPVFTERAQEIVAQRQEATSTSVDSILSGLTPAEAKPAA